MKRVGDKGGGCRTVRGERVGNGEVERSDGLSASIYTYIAREMQTIKFHYLAKSVGL